MTGTHLLRDGSRHHRIGGRRARLGGRTSRHVNELYVDQAIKPSTRPKASIVLAGPPGRAISARRTRIVRSRYRVQAPYSRQRRASWGSLRRRARQERLKEFRRSGIDPPVLVLDRPLSPITSWWLAPSSGLRWPACGRVKLKIASKIADNIRPVEAHPRRNWIEIHPSLRWGSAPMT